MESLISFGMAVERLLCLHLHFVCLLSKPLLLLYLRQGEEGILSINQGLPGYEIFFGNLIGVAVS